MKKFIFIFCYAGLLSCAQINGQGFNHVWLVGSELVPDSNTTAPKARLLFNVNNVDTVGESRKMAFRATQATISDANGNFLFASNGCWIMDASGDTMLQGSGISPGQCTDDWNNPNTGLPFSNACLIIPYPGDSSKFVMFHQTCNYSVYSSAPTVLYYTIIDMSLNGGLGGVVNNQKNLIAIQDTISGGLAACKHANGRDWWIVAEKDSSNTIYKVLFTPTGVSSVTTQTMNMPLPFHGNSGQPCFSPDGTKFAYTSGRAGANAYHDVRIFSFDRCTGNLDSIGRKRKNGEVGFGLSFSPNSRYLYYSSGSKIYQLDTDAPNIGNTDTTVAVYDGYYYPYTYNYTDFWLMYLAANGKIYITSSPFTIDLHCIVNPDSADIACNVQQHSLRLPCYTVRQGLNHPNYYLGCDTTQTTCPCLTAINVLSPPDFKYRVYPNPVVDDVLNIGYLLPQNKSGIFQIYDITGKVVFKYTLPPWSNEQTFKLPDLSDGIYSCVITSGVQRASKKIAVIKQ